MTNLSDEEKKLEKPFPNPWPNEARGYRLFCDAWESDPLVWFHGTKFECLQGILAEGFKRGPGVESASFSSDSALALAYACSKRDKGKDGVVIAVRFETLEHPGIKWESSVLHLYPASGLQPKVIGYCVVPAAYQHV